MKKLAKISFVALLLTGCAGGQLTPTASAEIQAAISTVQNVLQQGNTGLLAAAPSIDSVLTTTHNQGDTAIVNDVVAVSPAATAALSALLAAVNVAVQANTGQAQVVAVNNVLVAPASTFVPAPSTQAAAIPTN